MPYKDSSKRKEATKERVRRYRALQKGVTPSTSEGVTQTEGVTGQGVTSGVGVTRLNPATMKPYTAMRDYPGRVLTEYERKWGWFEPHYEPGPRGYVVGDILDLQHSGYDFNNRVWHQTRP